MKAVNFHLKPAPVAVLAAEAAADGFHARFSAVRRAYLYRIVNRRATLALERGRAWFVPQALDDGATHAAAQILLGRPDFTSFRASAFQDRKHVVWGKGLSGRLCPHGPRTFQKKHKYLINFSVYL